MAPNDESRIPPHVAGPVEAIAQLHARAERDVPRPQRSLESFTTQLGRPAVVAALAVAGALWVAFNVIAAAVGVKPIDPPPFPWLQMVCSVGAFIMATIVLSTQNRQTRAAQENSRLDLQINVLAEQKLAKLIALVEELRRDMPDVVDRVDPEADAMTEALDPAAVATVLEETIGAAVTTPGKKP